MAQTVSVIVTAEERVRLAAIVGDRSRPLKHVQRARIVLHSADRLPVLEVARRASVSRPAVWRWQRRYAEEGMDGLLRDKTRPPGRAPVPMTTVARPGTGPRRNHPTLDPRFACLGVERLGAHHLSSCSAQHHHAPKGTVNRARWLPDQVLHDGGAHWI